MTEAEENVSQNNNLPEDTKSTFLIEPPIETSNKIQYNPDLAISVKQSDSDIYDMSRLLTGCAIIFNFEIFQNNSQFETRQGSTADVGRLVKVFGDLNINIENRVHHNPTYNSMKQRLKECKSILQNNFKLK